jgi:hypothetical protein
MENQKDKLPELIDMVLELKETLNLFLETFKNNYQHDTMNVAQVAKILNCTTANVEQSKFIVNKNPTELKKHLYISGNKRQIPCHNIGKANYKYKREDILAFMAGRRYRYNPTTKINEVI